MTYQDVMEHAREIMAPKCSVCRICNGVACKGKAPGPGGKGESQTFQRNVSYLADQVKLQMDVLGENREQDTEIQMFGVRFAAPVFCAPVGMVSMNYSKALNEYTYAAVVTAGAKAAGTVAFTGGGAVDECFYEPLKAIKELNGWGIPTLKPWAMEVTEARIAEMEESHPIAFAMDIDSAGLAHAGLSVNPMEAKSEEDLKRIVALSERPFLVKGIMTPESAVKAAAAGVYGIVVSNHGGRVLDGGLSTAEVLPSIRQAVGNSVKILVDGGVRNGSDVFKMISLGADGVLIGRPYAIAAFGGGAQGVQLYTEKVIQELKDTMMMTNCGSISDITAQKTLILR